jgi:hypothetical protein
MASSISGGGVLFSASKNVNAIPGQTLIGIFVSSTTSGTVAVYDSNATSTATKLIDTVLLPVGFTPMHLAAAQGHYIVVGGTISATAIIG